MANIDRCFVQFIHPGGEHGPDAPGRRGWNRGEHRRKFLLARGEYLERPRGVTVADDVVFWGEWEPESDVEAIHSPVGRDGPRWLHRPYYVYPGAYSGEHQNTDPFVFGDRFMYTLCRQTKPFRGHYRPTFLRDLAPGSLILFGSLKRGEFVLDTVLVVAAGVLHNADDWQTALAGRVSDTYVDVTLRPTYQSRLPHDLRLYSGATMEEPVAGMFSFVPCLPAGSGSAGFLRPQIRLDNVITPGLMMGAKVTRHLSLERVKELWDNVVAQMIDQDLALGTRFKLPPKRDA